MTQLVERALSLLAAVQHPSNQKLVPLARATIGTGMLVFFVTWCYRDYQEFLALGPGGVPYNARGWAWITFGIRPFALSKSGTTRVADYPEHGAHPTIARLPVRRGARACLGGIAPHRQLSQHAPEKMRRYIQNLFHNAVAQNPGLLETKRSLYERHHDALFVSPDLMQRPDPSIAGTARVSRGEIAHMHPDLSIHLYLSPADARQAIQREWAERHRLSVPRSAWVKNLYAVADTYLMVYGPRDEDEMEVLKVILMNSIRYMTGREAVEELEWRTAL